MVKSRHPKAIHWEWSRRASNIEVVGNDMMGSLAPAEKMAKACRGDGQPTLRVAALTIGGTAS